MSDDRPGPPSGATPDDRPGDRPTEPLSGPPPPEPPPPADPAPTVPVPDPPASPGSPPPPGQTWPQAPPPVAGYDQGTYAQPGYGPPPYPGQPGPGQQPGYGPPPGYGYGYPPGPQTDSTATAALVIAVVGFFICAPVGAIVALVLANSAQKRIEESNGRLTGLEQAKAARIIAIIELALTAVVILVGVLAVAASLGARY
jgi:hypothetical protein